MYDVRNTIFDRLPLEITYVMLDILLSFLAH